MRDIIVLTLVFLGSAAAIRRPWVGVMLWTWVSIMNPHRMAWGIAYGAPVAACAAISTLVGMLVTKDRREWPFKGSPVVVLAVFMLWITLSWLNGLGVKDDYEQWDKVMKIDFMILVGLSLLHSKKQIYALAWVAIGSMGILGLKGGIFTIAGGGTQRVWGPPGSFIEDNNEFGLALTMTIPMLRFLQMQLQGFWKRQGLTLTMLLCAAAALGTQSRGTLLAISAMALVLWWRGRNRLVGGIIIFTSALALVAFMPSTWTQRMNTIETYQDDGSALGRIGAWSNAWNLAFHYPLGVGFNAARQELFDRYSSMPEVGARAAHSIYFQILGNHGFIGLGLFLLLWLLTWTTAGWLRTRGGRIPQTKWCADLGSMIQVSLVGYFIGGAFLSLAYFDLPYDMMMLAVLARRWMIEKAWEKEPVYRPGWRTIPGLATPTPAPADG
ncbi:MAG: putative O-glycosylation ligase, exosortase A system-associated [Proteobacteria bacterium]|nr:putative O-glycosylation ligase, exosortase A system-associated [Pseudomonadota bacterium]